MARTAALTTVENKTLNVNNLLKKSGYNTKDNKTGKKFTDYDHDKYISNLEFKKLTAEHFSAWLAQANISSKSDIGNFVKKVDFDDIIKTINKKITSNKTKYVRTYWKWI